MNPLTRHETLPAPLPFLLLTAALLIALPVSADVPRHFSYQGVLTDDARNPLPGPVTLRVRLYDAAIGGTTVFDETHPTVELDGGVYSISIGSKTTGGIPDAVIGAAELWLGLTVDGSNELSPRISISTSIFAIKARFAEELLAPGTSESAVTVDGAGNVGIGTPTPNERLTVHGVIETLSGGIRFPDGSLMTSALGGNSISSVFNVHRNGLDQTEVPANTATMIDWTTATFDINSDFDLATDRFTPSIPGKYLLTAAVFIDRPEIESGSRGAVLIHKNDELISIGNMSFHSQSSVATTIADANGTSDYFQVSAQHDDTANNDIAGLSSHTYFSGFLINAGNRTSLGSPDGTPAVAVSVDDSGNVGIGTDSPNYKLEVNGSIVGKFEAGDVRIAGFNGERSRGGTSYLSIAEYVLGQGGTLRIEFSMHSSNGSDLAYAQVYRNGSAVGTEWSTTLSVPGESFSEDISGWSSGDVVQLLVRSDGNTSAAIAEFWIKVKPGPFVLGIK